MRRNYLLLTPVALMFIATMNSSAQESLSDGKNIGIHRVYDYSPAPGQFLNTMPEYEEGDTKETIRQKAEDLLRACSHAMSMHCLCWLSAPPPCPIIYSPFEAL